jgi:hypothetical protein
MNKSKNANDAVYNLPVYAGAADVKIGAFLKPGVTYGTDGGALIKQSGNNAGNDTIGRLLAGLDYSEEGETLVNGTSFVVKPVELAMPFRIFRVEYDLTSYITCTQAVSTTTMTVTSLEDDIDAGFVYVATGTGVGQLRYLTASAAGAATLKSAFTTDLDTTSKFVKILPRFHGLASLNTDGTKLASQAAVGTWKVMVIDTYIGRGAHRLDQLSPVDNGAMRNLDDITGLKFYADIAIRDAVPASID